MHKVGSSATAVTWGLIFLILGSAAFQIGQSARVSAAFSMYSSGGEGMGWVVIGSVLGLVGLITLVSGVHQLAVNVDVLAQSAAAAHLEEVTAAASAPDPIEAVHDRQSQDR